MEEVIDNKPIKKKKKLWIVLSIVIIILILPLLVITVALLILSIRTKSILNDYSMIYTDEKYQTALNIEGINVITQDVSCGYAVIEMFAQYEHKDITEESLYAEYGRVVTSTGDSFANEMNKRFPEYQITIHKYLTNTDLIDMVYDNLSRGFPVPFEWAALFNNEWTLHYSLITGIDIPNKNITIANPYGYYENITISEFLSRTSFESFKNMPIFFKLGFAFSIFEKNTIFTIENRA